MKNLKHYILTLTTALVFVGCADEANDLPDQDIEFCVRAAWQDGLSGGTRTRALSATDLLADLLADGETDINIEDADYPTTIEVTCSDGNYFTLTKGTAECAEHTDAHYWTYTPSYLYKLKTVIRHTLTFHATAQIDDPTYSPLTDELEGDFGYKNIHDGHMQLTLHHTRALLRFTFKVSEKYDKVRYIVVKDVKINGNDCTTVPKVIDSTTSQAVAYMYINPYAVDPTITSTEMQIECTYDIYEKDAYFPNKVVTADDITNNATHLTRSGIVAQNTFTLNKLVYIGSPAEIRAGYYYDLRVTLNPDYLYVLSEHDNKHMTIE